MQPSIIPTSNRFASLAQEDHSDQAGIPMRALPGCDVEQVKKRESEFVSLPCLPNPGEGERWYRDVQEAILVASARIDFPVVNEWTAQARATHANPDVALSLDMCHQSFLTLDAKLSMALKRMVRESPDSSLVQKIDRLEQMSYARNNVPLSGRRTLREILEHCSLDMDTLHHRTARLLPISGGEENRGRKLRRGTPMPGTLPIRQNSATSRRRTSTARSWD